MEKKLCAEFFNHTIAVEFAEDSLSDVMISRRKESGARSNSTLPNYFNEHEVWAVFSQVVTALNYLYENHLFFGDLQPLYIHVFNRTAMHVKLFDPKYCSTEKTAYKRVLQNFQYKAVLCPIGLKDLQGRRDHPSYGPEKSEVFSLGMTILSMLMCEDFTNLYDMHHFTIDFEQIGNKLSRLRSAGYSEELLGILVDAISFEEGERPNIARLMNMVLSCKRNTYSKQFPSGFAPSSAYSTKDNSHLNSEQSYNVLLLHPEQSRLRPVQQPPRRQAEQRLLGSGLQSAHLELRRQPAADWRQPVPQESRSNGFRRQPEQRRLRRLQLTNSSLPVSSPFYRLLSSSTRLLRRLLLVPFTLSMLFRLSVSLLSLSPHS